VRRGARSVNSILAPSFGSGPQEVAGIDSGLPQNRSQRSFGHVTGMIWDRRVSLCCGAVPDLMTSRGLPVELESECLEATYNVAVSKSGQSAQLISHDDCVVLAVGCGWQRREALTFASRFNQLLSHITGDLKRLGNGSTLRHQPRKFFRSRQIDTVR
jgi:hypothetical protein